MSSFITSKRAELIDAIKTHPFILSDLSAQWRDDKLLVMAVVAGFGYNLKYASARLCDDGEVVRVASCGGGRLMVLKWASKRLLDDIDFVIGVIGCEKAKTRKEELNNKNVEVGFAKYFGKRVLDSDRLITAILSKFYNASILQYASANICDNKALALLLMKSYKGGWHLDKLSKRLRDDEDVVFTAIRNSPFSIMDASRRLLSDREFVLKVVSVRGETLTRMFRNDICKDVEIMKVATMNHYALLMNYTYTLLDDQAFIEQLIMVRPKAFKFMNCALANDFDIATIAIMGFVENIKFVGRALMNNIKFLQLSFLSIELWGAIGWTDVGRHWVYVRIL